MLALLKRLLPHKEMGWAEHGEEFTRFQLVRTPVVPTAAAPGLVPREVRSMSYKMRRDERGKLHKVVVVQGIEGYIERWTSHCSGCTEYGEYGHVWGGGGSGCEECGYTGRRRREWWEPFDWNDIPPSRFDHLASEVISKHGFPE